ncbi:MAG TPA: hypothetical protein VLA61_12935 [Ideonella sp.]|uniref:hypothetical protein n=1 Tax=Ideonella sp. TaxID=1929293 RepID=UPI002BD9F6FD|nr:hypothetical protein [Ideonella sp.]HSI49170.1 hypothetical protein [Ideonella sp.]
MDDEAADALRQSLHVYRETERLLGARARALLSGYGRLMSGPFHGRYVSGIPFAHQLELVHQLTRGETIPVHLMHRHVSGNYESSLLRWSQADGLVMVFHDCEEKA